MAYKGILKKNRKKVAKHFVGYEKSTNFALALKKDMASHKLGRLAQLVQSVCLTSRGSAVRIRQRPLKRKVFDRLENGSLAQLNRALDYGSRGYRFESYTSHKMK